MAKVTVKKEDPKPLSKYEGVKSIHLELDPEEAKAIAAVSWFAVGGVSVGRTALSRVADALGEQGLGYEDQEAQLVNNRVEFKR